MQCTESDIRGLGSNPTSDIESLNPQLSSVVKWGRWARWLLSALLALHLWSKGRKWQGGGRREEEPRKVKNISKRYWGERHTLGEDRKVKNQTVLSIYWSSAFPNVRKFSCPESQSLPLHIYSFILLCLRKQVYFPFFATAIQIIKWKNQHLVSFESQFHHL